MVVTNFGRLPCGVKSPGCPTLSQKLAGYEVQVRLLLTIVCRLQKSSGMVGLHVRGVDTASRVHIWRKAASYSLWRCMRVPSLGNFWILFITVLYVWLGFHFMLMSNLTATQTLSWTLGRKWLTLTLSKLSQRKLYDNQLLRWLCHPSRLVSFSGHD